MSHDPGLRRLALRTLLAAFPGATAPDWALELVADGLAGHTLFATNVDDPAQLAALTGTLRTARPDVLVAIDEEGGDVTRLGHHAGSPYPGNAALGAVDDPDLTRRVYAAIGGDLAAAGVNLDLAPTVDVNTADENPIIGTRSFGADPDLVARHAAAAVTGLESTGVAACAKHFPGHGATVSDSHLELPTVDVPLDVLRTRDLPPFAAAVAAGAQAVMSAHIRVPALTGAGPATFSRAALTGLLREELGFRGAIVTDALEMRGAAGAAGSIPLAAVAALSAGADLLCIGASVGRELVEQVALEIAAAVRDGRLAQSRLEGAAARTAALAAWAAAPRPAAESDGELGAAAARLAVRVEGAPSPLPSPLVVRLVSGSSIAEGRVPWGLRPHLNGIEQVDLVAASTTADEVAALAGDRPVVVVGRRLHSSAPARDLVEKLAVARQVSVVEMGWPSSWRPAGVAAFVVTHGASLANGRAAAEALHLAG
ncbi:putative glycosyl hydrolase [Actinoplanes missouriensis 431]|uniref:Putative glycosyl hydrolase n=1 Tax=Actinoplanes missouriensis (strain ATCC 14538 / DSM 43046 / CBS 188.64 / JCM 3121 / NBRC 102363 / NCIMB 12654 / NRRL B-3342 / UNCC 431) TaxID=512565 RepID=I0HH91_ACTM4|nr:glycoside hydrolase family 3 N-terminal domain-containing protein [Actinoplanes missouriensis]BAL92378.1 putative glycosyl hydrolase [Actinoplanes missouriensis 431]